MTWRRNKSDWLRKLKIWIKFNYKSGSLCPRTTQWSDWPALGTNIHWLGTNIHWLGLFWTQNLIGPTMSANNAVIWLARAGNKHSLAGPFWAQNVIGPKISDLLWLGPSKLLLVTNAFDWDLPSKTRGTPLGTSSRHFVSGHKIRYWAQKIIWRWALY